jgi:hypothetical protein
VIWSVPEGTPHDWVLSGFCVSLMGTSDGGMVASIAVMSSWRSLASAPTRLSAYERAACWVAADTGLPFTSTAPSRMGGSLVVST